MAGILHNAGIGPAYAHPDAHGDIGVVVDDAA